MERRVGRDHRVRSLENLLEFGRLGEASVRHGVEVGEIDDRADPACARRDCENVLRSSQLTHAAHDLHAEGNGAVLLLQPFAELAKLFDHRVDRCVTLAAE